MTPQEILTKAVQKAIEGGWNVETVGAFSDWKIDENGLYDNRDYYVTERVTPLEIIFNHDFAKSIWSDAMDAGWSYYEDGRLRELKKWEWHLMYMVLADDPIGYLGGHLPA